MNTPLPAFAPERYATLPMPLPQNFKKHSLWVLLTLAAGLVAAVFNESLGKPGMVVAVLCGVAAFFTLIPYMLYYFIAFPVLHAAKRYRGHSQNAWLVWLTLETTGLASPFIRLAYLLAHILPDIRGTGAYHRDTITSGQ